MKTITASMLVRAGACHNQLELFRETFPRGCRLTLANVKKAISAGLDVEWAVRHFAAEPAEDAYRAALASAEDAYSAALEPAEDAYFAATRTVRDAYSAAIESAWDPYSAALESARDAYRAAIESARDAYGAALAPHVLRALLGTESCA